MVYPEVSLLIILFVLLLITIILWCVLAKSKYADPKSDELVTHLSGLLDETVSLHYERDEIAYQYSQTKDVEVFLEENSANKERLKEIELKQSCLRTIIKN